MFEYMEVWERHVGTLVVTCQGLTDKEGWELVSVVCVPENVAVGEYGSGDVEVRFYAVLKRRKR